MATVKSSAENLTLNADGSGNDIKFQSNGVEKASIDQDGNLVLSGTLTSVGIDDNADATAITIDSSENVGIANTSPNSYDAEAKNLVVGSGTGHQGMTIVSGTSSKSKIHFADGTSAAAYKGEVTYNHSDDTLNLGTSGNYRLSISDADVTVSTGDLIFGTAGKGVCLGVTSNTDANTLDDYEEGSFTPVYSGSSGSAGSYDTGEAQARYQKIGKWVRVLFTITLTNKGSWGGEVRFTGLPFNPADQTFQAAGDCNFSDINYSGGSVGNCSVYVTSGVNYWRVFLMHDNDVSALVNTSVVDNASRFSGTFSYLAGS